MHVRQTSVMAYREIEANGLLSKRRWEVYQILYKYGPLTAHEVVHRARSKYPLSNQTTFNARLSELRDRGVVAEVGEKPDEVSKHLNILWDVTAKLPIVLAKKESKDQKIARLEMELAECREECAKHRPATLYQPDMPGMF